MPAPTAQLHLELVNDEEVIICRVLEINEPHWLLPTLLPVRQAISDRTLEQQLCCRLVDLHKPMPGCLLQVADGASDTRIVEPWLAVAQIELTQGRCQPLLQQYLTEAPPLGQLGDVDVALQPLPAHRLKLCTERLLDEVVFPLNGVG